ncbi:YaeP family protein [Aliivibrio sp. S4TY2]|uniref:YaeP family protein n=1 Tax=unclassified Aliivibrio TaxID=2645654 RepID=UPI0023786AF2|nr:MULTISPECIES: YaeP family protein [unclassified Aliivibrio]MDD9157140.1 YaeP family protein [Aliivibrio sp. S4TY2]MDD9161027.1 YaeP family protein [Aliivibrio sp. S4TY1]MDD9165052.1 YaeP family protein [Aliivibrio sp. S4MY2]MDD9169055.1 YaeP family protein [Aliivibrio sp. S4MY4]MDD9185783.1 YaeP family protein [Aliivibrio sp. S4MY3]
MKVYDCCEMVRELYSLIGSGDQGYIPQAITCAVKSLNDIAADEALPKAIREKAAFAAANLLISDFEDE